MFSDLKSVPYEDRLRKLGLWTLEERRNRADLLEIFKMVKGFSATYWTQFFRKAEGVTRGHSWKLYKEYNNGDIRQHSFSQGSIRSTAGIDCPRMKLMLKQSMVSRTVYRKEDNVRWTSSWTSCPQVQWLHELCSVID